MEDIYGCGNKACNHGTCYLNRRLMTGTYGILSDDPYRDAKITPTEAEEIVKTTGLRGLLERNQAIGEDNA